MRKPRTFTAEFKQQVVKEILSGTTRPARFAEDTISHQVFCIIGKNNMQGVNLDSESTQEEALLDRINKLEQMLGKLTTFSV